MKLMKGISCGNCPLNGKDCQNYKTDCKVKFTKPQKVDDCGRMVTVFDKNDFVDGKAIIKDDKVYCCSCESKIYEGYRGFINLDNIFISPSYTVYKNDILTRKINKNFHKSKIFDFIQEFNNHLPRELMLYFTGSALKNIILNHEDDIRDYDFIILNKFHKSPNLEKIFNEMNIKYIKKSFNGYKVKLDNSIDIDIWESKDLSDGIQYNIDMFFYCVNTRKFWEGTSFTDLVKTKKLITINSSIPHHDKNKIKERKKRCMKLVEEWIEYKEKAR